MIEVKNTSPRLIDQAAEEFMKELLRHFENDPPDVWEIDAELLSGRQPKL